MLGSFPGLNLRLSGPNCVLGICYDARGVDPYAMGSIPESFSTDFFTKYMALAARGKGCARGSQSGDIWTREETMRESLNFFDITQLDDSQNLYCARGRTRP